MRMWATRALLLAGGIGVFDVGRMPHRDAGHDAGALPPALRRDEHGATVAVQDSVRARIVVHVTDQTGAALPGAIVMLAELQRSVRSGADGVARFDDVPRGTVTVAVRHVGYLPTSTRVTVAAAMPAITLSLKPFTTRLAPVLTSVGRGGLSGVVSDTSLRPLAGVSVRTIGGRAHTTSDSAGAFFMPLRAGSYMVEIVRDSFARQLVGVTIPPDSGREIGVWLARSVGPRDFREQIAVFDLGQRIVRASPATTKFLTRESLTSAGIVDMAALARQWATGGIGGDCTIAVISAGVLTTVPLASVVTSDVEFVEVSTPSIAFSETPRGRTSITGVGRRIVTPTGQSSGGPKACGNVRLTVWLRS
jgi:hypothetical protein